MSTAIADPAFDAAPDANAAPIQGPIATGPAALPAASPVAMVPAALPDLPGGVPNVPAPAEAAIAPPVAAPATTPGIPAQPGAPIPPELQGLADATQARAEAQGEEGEAAKAAAEAKAKAEEDARVEHAAQAAEAEELRQVHAKAAQAAEDRTQRALIEARDAKIPDFWEGREGLRTSGALMVGLGGAAAGLLGTSQNGAADIIKGNVDSYYRREKEKIDNLYKFAESQGKMQDDLRLRQAAELAELQVQHGATNLAIADHINEIAAASQGRIDMAKANELKGRILEDGQKSLLQGRKTLEDIEYMKQHGAFMLAKAAKAKGGGGGGGVTGDAIAQFKQAIVDGTDDGKGGKRALTAPEIQRVANSLHIPAEAKAGHPSVASLTKDVAFVAGQNAKAGAAASKDNDKVAAFVQKQFKDDKEMAEELKANNEVRGALEMLKPDAQGLVNGVTFQQAIDKTVKAATGLGARKSSVDIFKGSLGGIWDKVQRFIQNGETGQYTAHDTKVLTDALKQQLAISSKNAAAIRARHEGAFAENPITKGHEDVYGAMLDEKLGKKAGPAIPPGAVRGKLNGKAGYVLNGQFTAL